MSDDANEIVVVCAHKAARTGKQCEAKPVEGYPLCQRHMETASIREIALVRGKGDAFDEIEGKKVDNPLEALADLVSEVLLYKDFCAQRVADLRGNHRYEGRAGEQLRAEVALYERSLDRSGKLLIEWSRLNIDERLSRIEEAKAKALLEIVRRTLQAADLTDEQRLSAEGVLMKEMRALANAK
jgi:hypothetical protein